MKPTEKEDCGSPDQDSAWKWAARNGPASRRGRVPEASPCCPHGHPPAPFARGLAHTQVMAQAFDLLAARWLPVTCRYELGIQRAGGM